MKKSGREGEGGCMHTAVLIAPVHIVLVKVDIFCSERKRNAAE